MPDDPNRRKAILSRIKRLNAEIVDLALEEGDAATQQIESREQDVERLRRQLADAN